MQLDLRYKKHQLNFRFLAGTSRGTLKERTAYIIFVKDKHTGITGVGEASPLKSLSPDYLPDFEIHLDHYLSLFKELPNFNEMASLLNYVSHVVPSKFPAIRFGIETALLDLFHGGKRLILNNPFFSEFKPIPINGLIWMGNEKFMRKQLNEKLSAGFNCIKMKIGAIDFNKELTILRDIRSNYDHQAITLRVDANGAFSGEEVEDKLKALADLDIHSIEQPIAPGQWNEMAAQCKKEILPIALDEELIAITSKEEKIKLIEVINPQFLILKPTLLGGILETTTWIEIAEERGIGWWITSALESNIGLNAICQLTATYDIALPQGLGTGQLYHNNFHSPLTVGGGEIQYDHKSEWDFSLLD